MDSEYAFTILPYIRVKKPFSFGEFTIWPDVDKNWKHYVGIKRPAGLLQIYVDKNGNLISEKTIISSKKPFNFERLRDLISLLYFIPSTRHFFRLTAETFYYESFTTRNSSQDDSHHTRIDKFVRSIVMSDEYKIYQPEDASYSNYELKETEAEYFSKLRKMFTEDKFENVIKSLSFYFRTQYRNSSIFPEFEDVQNFCTAFEILLKVSADKDIGKTIAESLYKYFSLADIPEREELKKWFVQLYKIRNDYTHGNVVEAPRLVFNNQRHIDIARQVYCEAIMKYLKPRRGSGRSILSSDRSLLVSLFSSKKVYDQIVKLLTNSWGKKSKASGKDNLLFLKTCEEKTLGELLSLSYKFVLYINKGAIGQVSNKRLMEAMQSILAVIDDLITQYSDPKYEKVFNTEIISELKTIPLFPKTEQEWEQVYQYLNNPTHNYTKVIGDLNDFKNVTFKRELVFREALDISMLAHIFTDLYYIYKGWHLL